jgi:hypothetical protein
MAMAIRTRARRIKIVLASIAGEARPYVAEAPALRPGTALPVVVEQTGPESYSVVDGFHRTAGMLRWCRENRIAPARARIIVVLARDPELIGDAAEPGPKQERALRRIYRQAGVICE